MLTCLQSKSPTKPAAPLLEWQRILEDFDPAAKLQAAQLWEALRLEPAGGVVSPYGLLLSKVADIQQVFQTSGNPGAPSVAPYHARMTASLGGPLYLGLDKGPDYARLAPEPNKFILAIDRPMGFQLGYGVATALLKQLLGVAPRANVDLHEWFVAVLHEVVQRWFGAPAPSELSPTPVPVPGSTCCMGDFLLVAKNVFDPRPVPMLTAAANLRGQVLKAMAVKYASSRQAACPAGSDVQPTDPLIDVLARTAYGTADEMALAWIGAVLGLMAPTGGTFDSILIDWLSNRKFWRLQDDLIASAGAQPALLPAGPGPTFLLEAVIESMALSPLPFLLHRSEGGPDPTRILGLASAGASLPSRPDGEQDPSVLFGYAAPGVVPPAQHACPGKEMAIGILLGASLALLERSNVRVELPPLTISYGA